MIFREIEGSDEKKEAPLSKVYVLVNLHSALDKSNVAGELSQMSWPEINGWAEAEVDSMPSNVEMDVLLTFRNITRRELETIIMPFIRGISGVKEAQWLIPNHS